MGNTYTGYHGTSKTAQQAIVRDQRFRASTQSTEWAGTGIYFFVDDLPYDNAKRWAEFNRHFHPPAVVKANIDIDSAKLFDVTLTCYRNQFHRFRERYYQKAYEEAKRAGKTVDEDVLDRMKLDCTVFNKICELIGFTAVKRQCYIRFLLQGSWSRYPTSTIPNCTILCVRDETQILSIQCAD